MPNLIVFTDLDATLLDHNTYSFDAAKPALNRLRHDNIPLVIVTSKTRAEITELRQALNLSGEDIPENGSWSRNYSWICQQLDEIAAETGIQIQAFHHMTPEEFATATGLPLESAKLAAQREYSEPFTFLDESRAPEFLAKLEQRGLHWTRGGRFHHVFEKGGKGEAVRNYQSHIRGAISIGLGDAPNDIGFLKVVDHPIIVRSPNLTAMTQALPKATVTNLTGPAGWNEAVLSFLDSQETFLATVSAE